ncbi:hypothetical protein [Pendulispora albinea]|uniref:DUF4231 domain-containing protein n=1 Tax=Pendulispora albinea TaxID=2741071 RepID=A0ABZ2MC51_9BACT
MVYTADEEQAKYGAWIAELESRRDSLDNNRRYINVLFLLAAILAPLGLFISKWVALGVAAFCIVSAIIGRYLIMIYRWDYKLQIERARADAEKLAHYRASPEKFDLPQDADDEERARYKKHRIPRRAVWRLRP